MPIGECRLGTRRKPVCCSKRRLHSLLSGLDCLLRSRAWFWAAFAGKTIYGRGRHSRWHMSKRVHGVTNNGQQMVIREALLGVATKANVCQRLAGASRPVCLPVTVCNGTAATTALQRCCAWWSFCRLPHEILPGSMGCSALGANESGWRRATRPPPGRVSVSSSTARSPLQPTRAKLTTAPPGLAD